MGRTASGCAATGSAAPAHNGTACYGPAQLTAQLPPARHLPVSSRVLQGQCAGSSTRGWGERGTRTGAEDACGGARPGEPPGDQTGSLSADLRPTATSSHASGLGALSKHLPGRRPWPNFHLWKCRAAVGPQVPVSVAPPVARSARGWSHGGKITRVHRPPLNPVGGPHNMVSQRNGSPDGLGWKGAGRDVEEGAPGGRGTHS